MLSTSRAENNSPYMLTIDSLDRFPNIINPWSYHPGDDDKYAAMDCDTIGWTKLKASMRYTDSIGNLWNGIGWFRKELIADSTVAGKPLAMTISHFGASEIFLDGKKLKSFGKISGPDSSFYYDPRGVPFIFMLTDTGRHVIAVRYANYAAKKNYDSYNQPQAGFELMIGQADSYIETKNERSTAITFIVILLGGIFVALALVHLFLFFYHRADKTNIYFSIFMLCIAAMFFLGFIGYASTTPSFVVRSLNLFNIIILLACIALSGFIRELFVKGKWRFILICSMAIISVAMEFLHISFFSIVTAVVVISSSFEAVFTIIFGMIRRVKGSAIIGSGILLFTLLILTLVTMGIASGGTFDINDSTLSGQIIEMFIIVAVLSIPVSMSLYQAWRFASVNKDLEQQLVQVKMLSEKTIEQEQEKKKILEGQKEKLEEEVTLRTSELRIEKQKSDNLLLNILPSEVAEELKQKGKADAKQFDQITVMFTDFKGFTQISEKLSPAELVAEIDHCFKAFDDIIGRYNIEKIKTIGDSYMCAGGLPVPNSTHAGDVVKASRDILEFISTQNAERKKNGKEPFEIRIGIHSGPAVAGIVGVKKFAYDIWGDTVNIASRMESSGEAGKINISGTTYDLIKDKFTCTHRGKIQAKNKGEIDMYFVEMPLASSG